MKTRNLPRLEVDYGNTYIFTRYISFQKKKTEYATTKPVLLIKTKDYIFSVTIEKLTGIEKILNGKIGSITTNQPHLTCFNLQRIHRKV